MIFRLDASLMNRSRRTNRVSYLCVCFSSLACQQKEEGNADKIVVLYILVLRKSLWIYRESITKD
jgi:hypothetical protein